MDRYQRIEKPGPEAPTNENEIRITTRGRMRNYITYAITLLQEKGSDEISLKTCIVGLHQNISIGSMNMTDTWEPLENGLLLLETSFHVSVITITLSKKELDTSSTGYQLPIPADQLKSSTEYDYVGDGRSPGRRGRGHFGCGRLRAKENYSNGVMEYNGDNGWDDGQGYGGRGRGRGRGHGYRGRGRVYGSGNVQPQSVD